MKTIFYILSTITLIFGFSLALSSQNTISIPADYPTIQKGLNAANSYTTILVSPGIYYENLIWPEDKDGIKLIGAEGSAKTFIDGGKDGRVIIMEGDYFTSTPKITNATVLKGFTIQNGKSTDEDGTGLFCSRANPTLYDLIFTNNICTGEYCSGAGAYLEDFNGIIENCKFIENTIVTTSRSYGAGLNIGFNKNVTIKNCIFEKNSGTTENWCFGGGLYIEPSFSNTQSDTIKVSLNNCKFLSNTTQTQRWSFGAGVYVSDFLGNSPLFVTIDSCQFHKNKSNVATWSHGGGLHSEISNIIVKNSQFTENESESGAGIYFDTNLSENTKAKVENTTFSKNKALDGNTSGGSAIYTGYDPMELSLVNVVMDNNQSTPLHIYDIDSKVELSHCTIFNNQKNITHRNCFMDIQNSVLWNKSEKEFNTFNSKLTIKNSVIKGGYQGQGNIDMDPMMINDFLPVPRANSPCLSKGILIPSIQTDILGYPRRMPANSLPDLGAYEVDQYFAHILIKYYYDINQNRVKDGEERYVNFGSVVDHRGDTHINNYEFGTYIILQQGTASIEYLNDGLWKTTGQTLYQFNVNSEQFESNVEIGLFPDTNYSLLSTVIMGDNFRCGEEVRFSITLTNSGTDIESGIFWVNLDDRLESITFDVTPDETFSDQMFGWRFQDLYPGESITNVFYITAPRITEPEELGEFYSICHGISGLSSRDADCYFAELRCSFDPNDKFALPQRADNLALIDVPLIYTIRFQNTGNDYARHVIIRDTIDPSFNLRSIKILQTSHPEVMNVSYNEAREVVFAFNNIYLPDSTTNYVASNGYVVYSLEHNPGIIPQTIVNNTANIYFDFNPPIVTNTTKNILVTSFPSSTHETNKPLITVYPNPASDVVTFSSVVDNCTLFNLQGQVIKKSTFTNNLSLNCPAGIYILRLESGGRIFDNKITVIDN